VTPTTSLPSAKVTVQSVTSLIVAVIVAVALHLYGVELTAGAVTGIASAAGWAVGLVAGYFKAETRPPASSFPYLPPEVAPPQR